jgi:hypothetical protein
MPESCRRRIKVASVHQRGEDPGVRCHAGALAQQRRFPYAARTIDQQHGKRRLALVERRAEEFKLGGAAHEVPAPGGGEPIGKPDRALTMEVRYIHYALPMHVRRPKYSIEFEHETDAGLPVRPGMRAPASQRVPAQCP